MADDTNKDRSYAGGFTESGFDASIPVWDGKADSLREFRRMTTWWLHSIKPGADQGVQPGGSLRDEAEGCS